RCCTWAIMSRPTWPGRSGPDCAAAGSAATTIPAATGPGRCRTCVPIWSSTPWPAWPTGWIPGAPARHTSAMTTTSSGGASARSDAARVLHIVHAGDFAQWRDTQPAAIQAWLDAQGFDATPGTHALLPGADGVAGAVIGVGDRLDPYAYAHAPAALPAGDWAPASPLEPAQQHALQLGWGLGTYRFSRYKPDARAPARLALDAPDAEVADLLEACVRVRDLVNTPTQDMGPDELEAVARDIAAAHGGTFESIAGDELLAQNFPAIHAVGRASHRAPRLLKLQWGFDGEAAASHPHVVLVGKGVCFDTGGLDIKPADGMRNMKKDMGGAAHAIALAGLVMARALPLRLTLLVPAVENAI